MSTEVKHTPKPWHHVGKKNALKTYTIFYGHGEHHYNQICQTEKLEDAKLIAAAPDLLEALRLIRSQSVCHEWTHEKAFNFMRDTAKAAIAKAGTTLILLLLCGCETNKFGDYDLMPICECPKHYNKGVK